jgi:type 2 lantibiotic biosynthesis protein LanM
LDAWREAHWFGGLDQLAGLLAGTELDEAGLLALLAEEPAELAKRAEKPEWARTAESVLAAMHPAQAVPDPPEDDEIAGWTGLAVVVAPFVEYAVNRLAAGSDAAGPEAADPRRLPGGMTASLERTLVLLAARTLVLELHVLRESGQLGGDTPRQRYWSFVRHFAGPEGLARLLAEYPVLARLLVEAADRAVSAGKQVLSRLAADRACIVGTLLGGADPGPLVELRLTGADWCDARRSPALLRFSDGSRIVYRPHQLGVFSYFQELTAWLSSRRPGLDLRCAPFVDRATHGWVRFVAGRTCENRTEWERLYHRWGAMLALLHGSGATDLRNGDAVACGEHPVPVDLAGLFQDPMSVQQSTTADSDPAAAALRTSVRMAELESSTGQDRGGLRMGYPGMAWAAPGTDRMRLSRSVAVSASSPRMPGDGEAALLAGFRAAYDALVAHGVELVGSAGLLWRFGDAQAQLSVRSPEAYELLLADSTHPDLMRDALDRDRLLGHLLSTSTSVPAGDDVALAELTSLRAGIIPRFSARAGSRDLVAPGGAVIPGVLRHTPLERVSHTVRATGRQARAAQEWIIRAQVVAAHSGTPSPAQGFTSDPVIDAERCLAIARGLADRLADSAYRCDDRAAWLGLITLDDRAWAVRPAGVGLDGYPGIALFLAKLAELTGDERYAALARGALTHVPLLLDSLDGIVGTRGSVSCGPFHGISGLGYALVQVADSLRDPALLAGTMPSIAAMAMAALQGDPTVVSGTAGCVAAMLSIGAAIESSVARRVAQVGVRRLIEIAAEQESFATGATPAVGFARGASGVGWALLRHAAVTGQERSAEAGYATFRALRKRGLPDRLGWCEGVAGIGLALVGGRHPVDTGLAADLDSSLAAVVSTGPLPDDSLCHGELGCLELLTVAVERGRTDLNGARLRRANGLLERLERIGPRCGTPRGVTTPGLLTGLAGIGYGLLRLGFPDRVPSVALLDLPLPRASRSSKGGARS